MAESSRFRRRCWKRHIVRQLKQRDRAQKALFLDLVQASTGKKLEFPAAPFYGTITRFYGALVAGRRRRHVRVSS